MARVKSHTRPYSSHAAAYLHFDIRVRVAVSVHGSQVNAAHHPHNETVGLGAVHEGHQDPTTLLYLPAVLARL